MAARGTSGGHDILLLDAGQPEVDGIDICRRVRAAPGTPIIFVSARSDAKAVVAGLDAYITKRFVMAELIARVGTQARRAIAVRSQTAKAPARTEP